MKATRFNKNVVASSSPVMRGRHFDAYDDNSDDYDGPDGGVRLCDFDEDGNYIGGRLNTTSGNDNTSSTRIDKFDDARKRTTIAPIGTGRFSQSRTSNDLNKTLNDSLQILNKGYQAKSQVENIGSVNQSDVQAALQTNNMNTADMKGSYIAHHLHNGNPYAIQYNKKQNLKIEQAHAGNLASNSGYQAPQQQYPQFTKAVGYSSRTNTTSIATTNESHMNQQSDIFGTVQDHAYPSNTAQGNSNVVTPAHQQNGTDASATPFSPLAAYNKTEPRNFAPRTAAGVPVFLPPPPFNLNCNSLVKKNDANSHYTASETDPFSSPPLSDRTFPAITSRDLVLSTVHEEEVGPLAPAHLSYGPVPQEIRALRSEQLNRLTDTPIGLPTQDVALDPDNFPFIESCTQATPVPYGVVKICNIPFGTKRSEIIAFLGRNSKILNDNQEPVHIIMERVTSKTQDAYVEFMTLHDAARAVERHQINVQRGRVSRLGDRPVDIYLSSQAALMHDLFPLAAGVFWDGSKPIIQKPVEGQPWKTFKGFVTEEEMTMLVKHVEIPQRSPYSKECPQRPYECMISTIKKLPWYMTDYITVRQRYAVYSATYRLVTHLAQTLQRHDRTHETVINEQLLKRLVTAAMLCPGFTVVQKDNIAAAANLDESRTRLFNQPRFADLWTHLYALCPKPGTPLDVLEWYIAILREETTRSVLRKSIQERTQIQAIGNQTELYFGYLWYELGFPPGKQFDNLSLSEVARRELEAMERILRRALPKHL